MTSKTQYNLWNLIKPSEISQIHYNSIETSKTYEIPPKLTQTLEYSVKPSERSETQKKTGKTR